MALVGSDDRVQLTEFLRQAVDALARGGADLALFAANTPHIVFDDVQRHAPIPLVSLVEATAEAAQALGLKRVGLLGTRFTMQERFYPDVFAKRDIAVVVPSSGDRDDVHDKYINELVAGQFLADTRRGFVAAIDRMRERDGIDGVILGGTELPLLLRDVAYPLPFLDTTRIHVDAVLADVFSQAVANTGRQPTP